VLRQFSTKDIKIIRSILLWFLILVKLNGLRQRTTMSLYDSLRGKSVKVFLKNGHCYSGFILESSENGFSFRDKFGLNMVFSLSDVSLVKEASP